MTRRDGVPTWLGVVGFGFVLCVLALIATLHGYTLTFRSMFVDVEMRPPPAQLATTPLHAP